jgi:hypothetical protein
MHSTHLPALSIFLTVMLMQNAVKVTILLTLNAF